MVTALTFLRELGLVTYLLRKKNQLDRLLITDLHKIQRLGYSAKTKDD